MQHLAYQPLLPAGNRYLQQKWDKACYEIHRRNVQSVKPTINTTAPKTYSHLAYKLEKEQLLKIERENNRLREKISYIMKTTGRIDNRQHYELKSLGKEKRQRELQRITQENQLILQRLDQCKSCYNVKDWEEDWLRTLKYMESITHYPRRTLGNQKVHTIRSITSAERTEDPSLGTGQSSEGDLTSDKETDKEENKNSLYLELEDTAAPETSTLSDTARKPVTPVVSTQSPPSSHHTASSSVSLSSSSLRSDTPYSLPPLQTL